MPQKVDLAQFDSPIVLIEPLAYPKIALVYEDHAVYVRDQWLSHITMLPNKIASFHTTAKV